MIEMQFEAILPFIVVLIASALRVLLGWLKAGGKFDVGKFIRTVLIGYIGALIIIGTKISNVSLTGLFFSVLTLNYAIDDMKNTKKKPIIGERKG